MKQSVCAAAAAAMFLAGTLNALADDHHDQNHGNMRHVGYAHQPPHHADARRFRQGQVWRGHRLAYRNGHWGYYQPHNGVSLFVNIPI